MATSHESYRIAIVIGILTARSIAHPILSLNAAAKNIARGEWAQTLEFDRADEVGQLAKSFTSMVSQLQTSFLTLPGVNARGFLDQPVNLPVDVTTNE